MYMACIVYPMFYLFSMNVLSGTGIHLYSTVNISVCSTMLTARLSGLLVMVRASTFRRPRFCIFFYCIYDVLCICIDPIRPHPWSSVTTKTPERAISFNRVWTCFTKPSLSVHICFWAEGMVAYTCGWSLVLLCPFLVHPKSSPYVIIGKSLNSKKLGTSLIFIVVLFTVVTTASSVLSTPL